MESGPRAAAPQRPSPVSARDPRHADNVAGQLQFLRKDAGLTPTRLTRAALVQQLLGGPTEAFPVLRERLLSAIHSLDDTAAELLLDIFGLSPATEGMGLLKQRRAHYGARHGIRAEAVADREAGPLDQLRRQLVTGWYPKSPTGFAVPQSHNGFIQEAVSILTIVRNRAWHETREHYRLIAAFDEADYISISSSFASQPVLASKDFTVRTVRIGDSFTHQFWHTEPMRRGQTYDLAFRLVPEPEYSEPGALTEESRAFHEPTRYALFQAVFIGDKPRQIWSYQGLSFFERPGNPRIGQPLTFGGEPGVRAAFHDLHGGLHSGIAWEWQRSAQAASTDVPKLKPVSANSPAV